MYGSDSGGDTCLTCGRTQKGCACRDPGSSESEVMSAHDEPVLDSVNGDHKLSLDEPILGLINDGTELSLAEISHPFPEKD